MFAGEEKKRRQKNPKEGQKGRKKLATKIERNKIESVRELEESKPERSKARKGQRLKIKGKIGNK
jgi:hypothetical protein